MDRWLCVPTFRWVCHFAVTQLYLNCGGSIAQQSRIFVNQFTFCAGIFWHNFLRSQVDTASWKFRQLESKTFDSKSLAKIWATRREAELSAQKVFRPKEPPLKISKIIEEYISQFGHSYGRSKNYDLAWLLRYPIADLDISQLTSQILINHCIERNKNAKPQTVKNDVIWLKTAIRTMRSVKGFTFDLAVFDDAYETLWREKLIGKSAERERRPTREELWALSLFFGQRKRSVPMLHIMWFAIYSARRLSEITRLEWTDNDEKKVYRFSARCEASAIERG